MLKYIDFLQQVEATPDIIRAPGLRIGSAMTAKASKIAVEMHKKSQMAEVLCRILKLWGYQDGRGEGLNSTGGVALLDEVDLLLHPLRSELNFPIGKKHPLPLSPRRWVLPMHLLDAVFFGALSRVSMPDFKPTSGTLEMLRDISLVKQRGEREFAVSSSPHPVLLSESFHKICDR